MNQLNPSFIHLFMELCSLWLVDHKYLDVKVHEYDITNKKF